MNKSTLITLCLLVFMGFFPFFVDSAWLAIGTTFLVFSVVALSQDIILGRAGVFHMGHAMFFGLGAYTTAILNVNFGLPILATLLPAVLIPMCFCLFVGCAYYSFTRGLSISCNDWL
ncbi:ABC transporter permease subunit [Sulfurospirillum diekertiae]|uniref:ABC transporter permease subunit n=1 Tax=Sulfurospirillum diekertiae TaxID=1854492 RepID=UPI00210F61F1|nr:hypothetical protein [Sulfurospirillum diekertiae]